MRFGRLEQLHQKQLIADNEEPEPHTEPAIATAERYDHGGCGGGGGEEDESFASCAEELIFLRTSTTASSHNNTSCDDGDDEDEGFMKPKAAKKSKRVNDDTDVSHEEHLSERVAQSVDWSRRGRGRCEEQHDT